MNVVDFPQRVVPQLSSLGPVERAIVVALIELGRRRAKREKAAQVAA